MFECMVRNSVLLCKVKLKKQEDYRCGNGNVSKFVLLEFLLAFKSLCKFRPQKKQQQKRQEMLSQLKKGVPIVLMCGLHGEFDSMYQQAGTV